jgi:SecD/SecF fusion protein
VIAYYSGAGLVANIALVFNIFFIIGILAQLGGGVALTLPGIAGIVLTIGMSIDANVLIFERIREELRHGSDLRPAIAKGYEKAFSSIIDSNVTTFLTGMILFIFGQGPVKGFAVVLMIGIGTSFLSAVYVTRVIVEWLARKGNASKLSFKTPFSKGFLANLDVDFISKRRIAYVISTTFIAIGMVLIFTNGLKLGVDLTGGRSYVVAFNEPVVSSDLKVKLTEDFEGAGTEVKTFGKSSVLKVTTSYLVANESSEADSKVENAMISGIEEFTGDKYSNVDGSLGEGIFNIQSSSKVGATIADDIKNASYRSIVFSLIVIFLYILIRFRKWQYSLGAIAALFHDTLFVLSAFAIADLFGFKYEVDQVFIAAMLTIIGYSINDTVVVFDRIRETLGLRSHADFVGNVNISINKTMSRTLITSLTTLIVIIVLLIWGGEVLKGFAFALFVGVLVGTYSSIFIATPTVVDLTKNKVVKPVEAKPEKGKVPANA